MTTMNTQRTHPQSSLAHRFWPLFFWFLLIGSFNPVPAWAGGAMDVGGNSALILRGVTKVVGATFQIPAAMLQDSTQVMFPFGILTGAVRGSFRSVAGLLSGALDIAKGGGPYAKYALL